MNKNISGEDGTSELRIKSVIIYFLSRDKLFKAAFVLGRKADDEIFACDIFCEIKYILSSEKIFEEARGIRIEIKNKIF